MSLRRKTRVTTFLLLFSVLTFTTFLFSLTFWDPVRFRNTFRLRDSFFIKGPCACARCVTQMEEEDPWFAEHLNLSFHPLMTSENSLLSEETFKWWKSLQPTNRAANFSTVVEELFELIPDEALYMDAGPERCRSCSVVGNSGNLKGSKYGELIDSSEFVIRMNEGRTAGFEEDVGIRTTHHVLYPESATDLGNKTRLILVPFKTLDLQWLISVLTTGTIHHTYQAVKSRINVNRDKVLIYNPTFFKYVYDSWYEGHKRYPSTGFLTLILALHICDEVSVFGYGVNKLGNWHHYWDKDDAPGTVIKHGSHSGGYEYNVTLLLAEKNIIKMYKGS